MKTVYKYINFESLPTEGRKTSLWVVRNNKSRASLGSIKWAGAWRQYIFEPITVPCIFSSGCLEDIRHFIKQLMDERSGSKKPGTALFEIPGKVQMNIQLLGDKVVATINAAMRDLECPGSSPCKAPSMMAVGTKSHPFAAPCCNSSLSEVIS